MSFIVPRGAARTLLISALLVLIASGCTKHKPQAGTTPSPSPSPSKPAAPPPPQANLTSQGVRVVDAQDRAQAAGPAQKVADRVVAQLNTFYTVAFVRPDFWSGGTHPALAGLFTSEARGTVPPNLQTLALGNLAPKLAAVDPTHQTAGIISVLIEPDLSASYAVATVDFQATGKPSAAGGSPVHIAQTGQFMFAKEGDDYRISAYDLHLKVDSAATGASFGGPFPEGPVGPVVVGAA